MSAHVLNLLNKLRIRDQMRGSPTKFYKFNNTGA